MKSLESALTTLVNREVAAWLNHHDLKVITGRLIEVSTEHIVIKAGDNTYFIPYNAIVAVRPSQ
jgi:ribosome maturation factor RimP